MGENPQEMVARVIAYQAAIAPKGAEAKAKRVLEQTRALSESDAKQIGIDIASGGKSFKPYGVTVIFPVTAIKNKVFDDTTTRVIGQYSLNLSTMPSGVHFVPNKVTVRVGLPTTGSKADVLAADFVGIHTQPKIAKGEITIGVDNQKLFKNYPMANFDTRGETNKKVGEVELEDSIVFCGGKKLEGEIELGDAAGIDPKTMVFLHLEGYALMSI